MRYLKNYMILALLFTASVLGAKISYSLPGDDNGFLGMWSIDVEGGGVGWLNVHEDKGYLDAELLWIGGSVLPVAHVYLKDENNLVVTRIAENIKSEDADGTRKHTMTYRLDITKLDNQIFGVMTAPKRNGSGESKSSFFGTRLPSVGTAPNLSNLNYGKPIALLNGKNLDGWRIINPMQKNGFKVLDGVLVNAPVQDEGHHVRYGNLRTDDVFEDFNLKLEVNVPAGNNSGIYLRGLYEIQVFDSFGKELDSHNMGAVYSRIAPTMAAEKPAGTWQTFDITLCHRHITVILNGKKIVDNQPVHGPTGGAISSNVFAPGPIFLQGDHGDVSYKNIVLTPIMK